MNTGHMTDTGNKITFVLDTLSKTSRKGDSLPSLTIHEYVPDPMLDPVACIHAYLRRTADWRDVYQPGKLLRSTRPPHEGAATSTISNWLKATIHEAGIHPDFKGHSTRSASTSKANIKGLSVKEILNKEGKRAKHPQITQCYRGQGCFESQI